MRNITFATGTRAEFGLMETTLRAIQQHPDLRLQIVATGMHLDARSGRSVDRLRDEGWTIDAQVPWPTTQDASALAAATGQATAGFAVSFGKLLSDIVLVVGDRVEALAAATAGHLSELVVAHVHGGDRATGQADDAMRHAITKLSHLHFPATPQSAQRLTRLGEEPDRIHGFGSPGLDGIAEQAAARSPEDPRDHVLLALHPTADDARSYADARRLLTAVLDAGAERIEIVMPNNDLGRDGIVRCWTEAAGDRRVTLHQDLPRPRFLRLLADAKCLIGNSSAGIIEAAALGTPVLDIGPRQHGRERPESVRHADMPDVDQAVRRMLSDPPIVAGSPYGGRDTGRRIADLLATVPIEPALLRKTIAY
jgi:UDP-hydrolysing UDP-N-acetyl-D-glucosamine 2-epimerase